jgi:hypothetical protein
MAVFAVVAVTASGACGSPGTSPRTVAAPGPDTPILSTSMPPEASTPPSPKPSTKPSATKKPSPKPKTTLKKPAVSAGGDIPKGTVKPVSDGVPTKGAGTFSVASGSGPVVGAGSTLVTYRVELENGIPWGSNTPWTVSGFTSAVDTVLDDPRSWIGSAAHPVTDPDEKMTNMSWSFQRVSGATYSVRIRLATPDTVDKLCGAVGVDTEGVYSCRYGSTILINLRRWLQGAPGFNISLAGYRREVINHEVGHLLGFNHMLCPGAGKPAPVMQTQTISLGGCTINEYPFAGDGTFVIGPWAAS